MSSNRNMFTNTINFFDNAAQHLKWPKVELKTESGYSITLKRAGEMSRFPGCVQIVMHKQHWIGRILRNGTIFIRDYEIMPKEELQEIMDLLYDFTENPEATAKAQGQKYGNCCFCGLELTNEFSLEAGYGPICAEKYGLYHGYNDPERKREKNHDPVFAAQIKDFLGGI